jgi:two-component system, chemotaxis family, response regulator Rcp1
VEKIGMITTSAVSRLRTQGEEIPPPDILLVEDEAAEIYLLKKGFATSPLPVSLHTTTSVKDALAFLRHDEPYCQAPLPQLIVTSLNLSGHKSGFELLDAVKQDSALRAIPVVVFSTYNETEIIQKSYALGANCYITKPNKLDAYVGAIHAIVEYWFTVAGLCEPSAHVESSR